MVQWLDKFGSLCRYDALIALMVGSSGCWAMGGSELIMSM